MAALDARFRADGSPKKLALLAGIIVLILALRVIGAPFISVDYLLDLSSWVHYLREHGFASFRYDFYNYNPPYLYVLYLVQLIPMPPLYVVKTVSFLFDLSLAAGVFAIVFHLRKNLVTALLAGSAALLLPEVFLNSAFWGQVDAGYTSFVVWAIYLLMRNKQIPAWILYATAVAFKAQAIFVLPAMLLIFMLKRQHIAVILTAMVTFLAWDIPCLLAGRPLSSIFSIYLSQTTTYHDLSRNSPNIYRYINNSLFDIVKPLGLAVAAITTVLLLVLLYRRLKPMLNTGVQLPAIWLLRIFALFAISTPYLLPQMHERYFYVAGIMAFIVAWADTRYRLPAILFQVANTLAYMPFLFGTIKTQFPYIPFTDYLVTAAVVPETIAFGLVIYLTFKRDGVLATGGTGAEATPR